jgi:two-component system sensor histidine kinase VicK
MFQNEIPAPSHLQFLRGGGEMGELIRSYDWSKTVLGHCDTWSISLLTTLSIILKSKFPMFLWWGTELIQFYNDAYRPSLGNHGKHPKALGQHGEDCWPEIWPIIKPLIDEVMSGGEATWQEDALIPIYRNDRLEDVYWTFSYSQVIDGEGEIGGVLVTCFETTKKVRTQQNIIQTMGELSESKARLHNLFTQAPVAIGVLKNRELIIETANNKLLQFWGKTEEVIGMTLANALPELEGQPFLQILDDVFTTGQAYYSNEVSAMLENDGVLKKYYLDLLYQPVQYEHGKTDSILVVATDLTEQVKARHTIEESAQQFQQLADSIIQMVWVTDSNGMHEYYNKRWYDFTGSDFETTKGEGWSQMFHPDDREKAWEEWEYSLKSGEPYEIEYRLRNKNGDYIWVLGRAAPFYDAEGKITKWFGTCTDINEQKILMQQKDDFISIASHELKTPITTLSASLQLLGRMKNNPSKILPTLVDQANRSLDKVNLLIRDLLNVTQFNNGQLHLNKSRVRLSELIAECCPDVRANGIYTIRTEGDINLDVLIDSLRIDQVLVNLVNNAIKYAPNSKEILISIERLNNMAKVSVTDKGDGIPADKIPHLFDRYFRVDGSGSQYSGLGLGLYICGEIIRKHEGEIGAYSEVGKGSTFWFTLPIN